MSHIFINREKLIRVYISLTRILASSDFILTSGEVKKMETQVQLLAYFRLLPQCLVEFTTKIPI